MRIFKLQLLLSIFLCLGQFNVWCMNSDMQDRGLAEEFDMNKLLDGVKGQRLEHILHKVPRQSHDSPRHQVNTEDPFQYPSVFNEQGDYFGNLDNPSEKISQSDLKALLDFFSCNSELRRLFSIFNNLDIDPCFSSAQIMLEGPPGVGKTTLSKILAAKVGLKYRFIDGAALFNAYKDSASSDLNHFIAPLVKQSNPCVIIMDEFTSVAERYNQECNGDKIPAMALWLLLDKCLNHSKIIFIGLTNDGSKLPEQLKSRLKKFKLGMPNDPDRMRLFRTIFQQTPTIDFKFEDDEETLSFIVKKTRKASLRDLWSLRFDILSEAGTRRERVQKKVTITDQDVEEILRINGYLENPVISFGKQFWEKTTDFSQKAAPYVIPWALSSIVQYLLHKDSLKHHLVLAAVQMALTVQQMNDHKEEVKSQRTMVITGHRMNLENMRIGNEIKAIEVLGKRDVYKRLVVAEEQKVLDVLEKGRGNFSKLLEEL